MDILLKKIPLFQWNIKNIGLLPAMDDYEKRRLGIFNRINFLGFLTGIIIPLAGMFSSGYLPVFAWVVACSPAFISGVVLISNYYGKYNFAIMWYFIMYSIVTAVLYAGGVDAGVELFFILYGVLAVFFLQDIKKISIAVSISVICYSIVFVIHGKYAYVMKDINQGFYVFNHLLSVLFIFMGLLLIKKENAAYQHEMKSANNELHAINLEIFQQRKELAHKANQLEQKTAQLAELDGLKNKLFSIIAHDLKTPIYSLQNVFKNVAQHDLSGNEIKVLVPDIMNNLDYTTGLMENLLQWAKSQMQGDSINQQLLEVGDMIAEVLKLLNLQADAKKVYIEAKVEAGIYIFADKDMMELVLRNLISNAIKFTPNNGRINVSAALYNGNVQVKIMDTGVGISNENIQHLFGKNYYSTRGSNNESGTGLGLKLCKEFINKNEGHIYVESELGKGSTFSFVLPKA